MNRIRTFKSIIVIIFILFSVSINYMYGADGTDFEVKAAPPHRTIDAGDSTHYTVTVKAGHDFPGAVMLSVTGLPMGADASFDTNPLPRTGESKLRITTSEDTPGGIYTLTITGTYGEISHSTDVILEINAHPPEPDFSITAVPLSQEIIQGESTAYTINLTGLNGFNSPINLSVAGLPPGVAGTFTINPVTPAPKGETVLNINTTLTTSPGTYSLIITGEGGGKNHSIDVTLKINERPPEPDFRIKAVPANRTVTPGDSTFYTVTVKALAGFNGAVDLAVKGLPVGVGASFDRNPLPVTGEAKLIITTTSTTPVGIYAFTVTGTSGDKIRSAHVTLEIKGKPLAPDFTIAASPSSRSLKQGDTAEYKVTVTAMNGFSSAVNLSVSGLPTGTTFGFQPNTITANSESAFTVTTTTDTPAGTYTLTITGEGAGKKHSAAVSLTVGCRDFSVRINVDPESGEIGLSPFSVQFEAVLSMSDMSDMSDMSGVSDMNGEFSAADFKFKWDFGDGGASVEQNPKHTFNAPGTYTAALAVTDSCGVTKTAVKTITVLSVEATLQKTVDKTSARPGDALEYRLVVKNKSAVPLTGIQLTDELSPYLEFVAQDGGLDFARQQQVLRWQGSLQAGQAVEMIIKTRIRLDVFAGTRIANNASLTAAELPEPLTANTVETIISAEPIPTAKVRFTKHADIPQADVGRIIRFSLTIENTSNSLLAAPLIEDFLPQGFSYVASSTLLNNQVFIEPRGNRRMEWQLPDIKPGETVSLRYQVVIGADAARGKNINRALLHTVDNSGQRINLEASAFINVSSDSFIFYSGVNGTVYLDRDNDAIYTMADTPLKDIEVCISTGQKNITDSMGHYVFENLLPGEYALNVNRATLPEKYRLHAPVPAVVVLTDGLTDTVDFAVKFSGDDPVKNIRLEGRVFFDKNQDQVYNLPDALLEQFKVVLDNRMATAGSKGIFVFTHLEPGMHMLEIFYEGRSIKKQVKLENDSHIDIPLLFTGIKIIVTSEK